MAVFQKFSDALRYITEVCTNSEGALTNYLDDFLFLALTLLRCNWLIGQFLNICRLLGVPILQDKTIWGHELVIFLGLLLDGRHMTICIPIEKRQRAVLMLLNFLDRKKATVKEIQELCGYLNFLCKAIYPGRPFLRQMYSKYSKIVPLLIEHKRKLRNASTVGSKKVLKPFHHMCLDGEFKSDCRVWLQFLDNSGSLKSIVNRLMCDVLG